MTIFHGRLHLSSVDLRSPPSILNILDVGSVALRTHSWSINLIFSSDAFKVLKSSTWSGENTARVTIIERRKIYSNDIPSQASQWRATRVPGTLFSNCITYHLQIICGSTIDGSLYIREYQSRYSISFNIIFVCRGTTEWNVYFFSLFNTCCVALGIKLRRSWYEHWARIVDIYNSNRMDLFVTGLMHGGERWAPTTQYLRV